MNYNRSAYGTTLCIRSTSSKLHWRLIVSHAFFNLLLTFTCSEDVKLAIQPFSELIESPSYFTSASKLQHVTAFAPLGTFVICSCRLIWRLLFELPTAILLTNFSAPHGCPKHNICTVVQDAFEIYKFELGFYRIVPGTYQQYASATLSAAVLLTVAHILVHCMFLST